MLLDLRIDEDLVNSEIFIWDAADVTINHLVKYTPTVLKKYDLCLVRIIRNNLTHTYNILLELICNLFKLFRRRTA